MKLRASYVWALAATVSLATALGGGACGGNGSSVPPLPTPPPGDTFDGFVLGENCSGDVFVPGSLAGFAVCEDGVWTYTTENPDCEGTCYDCGAPCGDDATADAADGDDATGDHAVADDATGDDAADDAMGDDTMADDAADDAADADGSDAAMGDASIADSGFPDAG